MPSLRWSHLPAHQRRLDVARSAPQLPEESSYPRPPPTASIVHRADVCVPRRRSVPDAPSRSRFRASADPIRPLRCVQPRHGGMPRLKNGRKIARSACTTRAARSALSGLAIHELASIANTTDALLSRGSSSTIFWPRRDRWGIWVVVRTEIGQRLHHR